jgi:hypothetical protein
MLSMIRRRWKMLATLIVAIPAMTYAAAPEWTEEALEEIRDYSENQQILEDALERREGMQDDLDIVRHRINMKEGILDRVESGQLSLADAGAQFLAMDRESDVIFIMSYRPGSLAECAQARVIRFVKIRHAGEVKSADVDETVRRLEHDFESRFGYPPPRD